MRARLALSMIFLLAAACKPEPRFENRYDAQSAKMNETFEAIEAELNNQLNASQAADAGPAAPNAARPITNEAVR